MTNANSSLNYFNVNNQPLLLPAPAQVLLLPATVPAVTPRWKRLNDAPYTDTCYGWERLRCGVKVA